MTKYQNFGQSVNKINKNDQKLISKNMNINKINKKLLISTFFPGSEK
jgi:hypothetical protein